MCRSMQPRTLTRLLVLCLVCQTHPAPLLRAAEEAVVQTTAGARTSGEGARTSGELIAALGRYAKPDWASKYRTTVSVAPNNRAQIALLMGSLFADGYLGAQAEDTQQCKNMGKEISALAKTLGVQAELLDRSRSLGDSAQKRDWTLLRHELEATESDLCAALRKHNDGGLAHLVTLGAWLRGTEIVSSLLQENYTEDAALLLRQPVLNRLLGAGLDPLNEKLRADPLLSGIRGRLDAVAQLLNGPGATILSREGVSTLAETLGSIFKEIASRQN